MGSQTALALLFLSLVSPPLDSQERWRSTVAAADRLREEGRFADAERLFQSALDEARRLEPDLAPAATTYHNLAGLYDDMGKCDAAVRAYQRAIGLWEKVGARGDTYLLRTANHLVALYLECGAVGDAERHYRALIAPRIAERVKRERDTDLADALGNLASIEYHRRKYGAALSHYRQAASIREELSDTSVDMAVLLNNLALAEMRAGDVERALADSLRSLNLIEAMPRPPRPLLVCALLNAADLRLLARRPADAEPLLVRALAMSRNVLGDEHPLTAAVMLHFAVLLKARDRKKEAAVLESSAREIRAKLPRSALRQTVDVRELGLANTPR